MMDGKEKGVTTQKKVTPYPTMVTNGRLTGRKSFNSWRKLKYEPHSHL